MHLIALGLLAVGGLYAWKALRREMDRLDHDEAERRRGRPGDTLEFDAETGRYRVRAGKAATDKGPAGGDKEEL